MISFFCLDEYIGADGPSEVHNETSVFSFLHHFLVSFLLHFLGVGANHFQNILSRRDDCATAVLDSFAHKGYSGAMPEANCIRYVRCLSRAMIWSKSESHRYGANIRQKRHTLSLNRIQQILDLLGILSAWCDENVLKRRWQWPLQLLSFRMVFSDQHQCHSFLLILPAPDWQSLPSSAS